MRVSSTIAFYTILMTPLLAQPHMVLWRCEKCKKILTKTMFGEEERLWDAGEIYYTRDQRGIIVKPEVVEEDGVRVERDRDVSIEWKKLSGWKHGHIE
jgi:hypothetical protein